MSDFSGFSAEKNAEVIEGRKLKAVRRKGREAAVEQGRLLGEQAAKDLGETGDDRDQRVRRAKRYAAWEFDGKPLGDGERYNAEFGVRAPDAFGSMVTDGRR